MSVEEALDSLLEDDETELLWAASAAALAVAEASDAAIAGARESEARVRGVGDAFLKFKRSRPERAAEVGRRLDEILRGEGEKKARDAWWEVVWEQQKGRTDRYVPRKRGRRVEAT